MRPAPASAHGAHKPAVDDEASGLTGGHRAVLSGFSAAWGLEATADFYLKLVRATPASRDQEHLRVLIWSDPTIPGSGQRRF